MPILEKITISNYRNIELQELSFSPNVNCIWGDNGEGKTNLLDAIYYLSMTKSAFSASDKFNFRYDTDNFSLCGNYRMQNGLGGKISLKVDQNGKTLRRDDKPYSKISEHIGLLPVVMVSPSDISLVSESGEERRKFLNAVLSQLDQEYLAAVQQYNRLLMQRNHILKGQSLDGELLRVLDSRLASYAEPIYNARKMFASQLQEVVARYYKDISGGNEDVSIRYVSDLDEGPLDEILVSRFDRDMALHYTTAGVQRDDLVFEMNGYPIRKCGSQGQQKSFLVALKFAQYDIMKRNYGFAPTLLLDDIFDKLDMGRISNLLGMVSGNDFGQIFITDCNKSRVQGIVDSITKERAYFETRKGCFTPVEL